IHLRAIDGVETRALLGTEGARHPFWLSGGDSLAFAAMQRIKRIDLASGSVRDLIATGFAWQAAWNQNDDLFVRVEGQLFRISGQGGAAMPIPNSSDATFPAFLRDGKRFLVRVGRDNRSPIQLATLGSAERTLVVDNVVSAPVLAPTPRGKTYLLFVRESDLMA